MEHKPSLHPGAYFHIYNRGINNAPVFLFEDDFRQFIHLMGIYLPSIADVYSYAVMSNHFHLALRIKTDGEIGWLIPENVNEEDPSVKWATTFDTTGNSISRKKPDAHSMIRHMLSAYSKWFNVRYNRSGKIFEERHERKILSSETQLRQLIVYINRNPEKHGVAKSFAEYPWISYHELIRDSPTSLSVFKVIELFGDIETFINAMNRVDFDDWLKGLECEVSPPPKRS